MSEQDGGQEDQYLQQFDRMVDVIQSRIIQIQKYHERVKQQLVRINQKCKLVSLTFALISRQHEIALHELREMRDIHNEITALNAE